jgi:hypothetical protein
MATAFLPEVIQELQGLSDRISAQIRLVAAGLLAVAWALLVSPRDFTIQISPTWLLFVTCLCLLTMGLDLAQYVFGYLDSAARKALMERNPSVRGWNRTATLYHLRSWCFWTKLVAVAAAFLALMVPLIVRVLPRAF